MVKSHRQQIVFVCNAIQNNYDLISEIVSASSSEEAGKNFEEKFKIKPKNILGPFLKKRVKPLDIKAPIKFSGKPKQAIYDGWLVNAFTLSEPENNAFLIFIKQVDNLSKQMPKGTVIVPINNLRFI